MDLKLKHVLVDTCFLIHWQKYSSANYFDNVLKILEENNCVPVINELIRQEFTRLAASRQHYNERNDFIEKFRAYSLPISQDIWEDAILISQICNFSHKIVNSITDSVIMAQMKKWESKLVLLTADLSDFQKPFIDRFNLQAIDVKNNVITIGFHKFNNQEFLTHKSRFERFKPKI